MCLAKCTSSGAQYVVDSLRKYCASYEYLEAGPSQNDMEWLRGKQNKDDVGNKAKAIVLFLLADRQHKATKENNKYTEKRNSCFQLEKDVLATTAIGANRRCFNATSSWIRIAWATCVVAPRSILVDREVMALSARQTDRKFKKKKRSALYARNGSLGPVSPC